MRYAYWIIAPDCFHKTEQHRAAEHCFLYHEKSLFSETEAQMKISGKYKTEESVTNEIHFSYQLSPTPLLITISHGASPDISWSLQLLIQLRAR